jgi:MFS family permease
MRLRVPDLGALHERQFRLLFTGQTISLLGDGIVGVALSFAVLDLTGSVSDLGYVFASRTIPLVVFLLVGGVFADRLPRRAVMLVADAVRFVSQGVMAALLLSGHAELWQLIVTQAVAGAASAFFNPASTGLTPDTVSAARLQQANALRGLSASTTQIVGPALSGVIVAAASPGWALAVDSASFALSAFFLGQLRLPPHERPEAQSFLRDLHDGWREFTRRTWVWANLVVIGFGNMATGIMFILAAYVSKRHLGGAGAYSLIVAAFGAGAVIGGLLALRIHPRRPLLVGNLGVTFLALPAALLALRAPAVAIAAAGLVGGLGVSAFNPLWETALQRHIPARALSRVSAYDWLVSLALAPIGQMLVGPITRGLGIDPTLWAISGSFVVGTAIVLSIPSVRDLRNGQVQPEVVEHVVDRVGQH